MSTPAKTDANIEERIRDLRAEGRVPYSPSAVRAVIMAVVLFMLERTMSAASLSMHKAWTANHSLDLLFASSPRLAIEQLTELAIVPTLWLGGLISLIVVLAVMVIGLIQTKLLIRPQAMVPRLSLMRRQTQFMPIIVELIVCGLSLLIALNCFKPLMAVLSNDSLNIPEVLASSPYRRWIVWMYTGLAGFSVLAWLSAVIMFRFRVRRD